MLSGRACRIVFRCLSPTSSRRKVLRGIGTLYRCQREQLPHDHGGEDEQESRHKSSTFSLADQTFRLDTSTEYQEGTSSDAAPARTYSQWYDRVGNSTKLFSSAAPAQIPRQVGFQASLAQLLSLGFLPTASRVISKHSRPVSHVSQSRLNKDCPETMGCK